MQNPPKTTKKKRQFSSIQTYIVSSHKRQEKLNDSPEIWMDLSNLCSKNLITSNYTHTERFSIASYYWEKLMNHNYIRAVTEGEQKEGAEEENKIKFNQYA